MKDTIKQIFTNPYCSLGTAAMISVTLHGIASIIEAAKDKPKNPGFVFTTTKTETEKV